MAILLPTAIFAFGGPGNRPGQQPPEAIEACQGQEVGASVTFINRRGDQVNATCNQLGDQLVAVPSKRSCYANKAARKMANNKMSGRHARKGLFGPDMVKMLNLTAEQQAQIDKFQAAQMNNKPNRDEMMAQRMKVKQAMMAEPFDEAALRSVLAEQNKKRTEMMVKQAQARQQLFNILTPAQQKTLAQQRFHQMMKHQRPHNGPDDGAPMDDDGVDGK